MHLFSYPVPQCRQASFISDHKFLTNSPRTNDFCSALLASPFCKTAWILFFPTRTSQWLLLLWQKAATPKSLCSCSSPHFGCSIFHFCFNILCYSQTNVWVWCLACSVSFNWYPSYLFPESQILLILQDPAQIALIFLILLCMYVGLLIFKASPHPYGLFYPHNSSKGGRKSRHH